MRADPELRAHSYEPWRNQQANLLNARFDKGELDASARPLFGECPNAINGAVICGPVVASSNYSTVLKALDRKVLAVETE